MPRSYVEDEPLKKHRLKSFSKGYNSYSASKSLIDDEEFPEGENVELDDNGSVKKRSGIARYGGQVASGKSVRGGGWFKTSSLNLLLVAAGTAIYKYDSGNYSALTGITYTDNKDTDFCQALDRMYIANGFDNLSYTSNGTTVTTVTNGITGRSPVSYNRRIYMTNTTYPDRLYFSNPYTLTFAGTTTTYNTTNFGSFDLDLGASPKKTAGFLILAPGTGLEITRLIIDGDSIYVFTKNHGIWKVTYVSANSDETLNHTVEQVSTISCPAGRSVVRVGNDIWFFGGDNFYTRGEVASFVNIRVSPKSARVKTEVESIAAAGKNMVAGGFYKDKLYFSYRTGSNNDRIIAYDTRLNAWSAPFTNINTSWFLEFEESDGTRRLLAGSDSSTDSYVYELFTGTSDEGTAIDAYFETKSTDCGQEGLVKRFGFIDVFYTQLFGQVDYEAIIDETTSVTGTLQVGTSETSGSGFGTKVVGTFLMGQEFTSSTVTSAANGDFRIECDYESGKRIAVKISNDNLAEQFKINAMSIYYQPGSIYETLD